MATTTATAAAAVATASGKIAPQAGIFEHGDPSKYNPKDPTTLFIIQAGLIIILCHLLHWPLSKIRQPRVIAEVIGGIVLGPSVMGHIPGFTEHIFPAASLPNLTLVANIGLILYLFMIGLETDVRFLAANWRIASSVAILGLALPFGVGCGLAWGIYHAFRDDPGLKPIDFSVYMLFVGIAIAITAFPVLCRILTALKLLDTPVGVITLAAGVANDVVGWILLALCVTLVNAGNGLATLYILLVAIGFIGFVVFAVKPGLLWLLRKTDNVKDGPSQTAVSFLLLVALASAFFTGIIGIHPIFGGFIIGLIVPREDRFNIYVIEKLEDLVGAIFLPLYFTLSGLSTNLGLLNTGEVWGYVFATTFTALLTKIIGASVAARLNGMVWRESFSIGVLMSCKGLVELIVLNIGLQAEILSTRTFTVFVVMALITTFVTTPLTTVLYPPWYQKKIEAWKRGEIDWETGESITPPHALIGSNVAMTYPQRVDRLLVYLRLDNMPALLGLLLLFGGNQEADSPATRPEDDTKKAASASVDALGASPPYALHRAVRAHGVRLLELSDRESSVMTVAQVDEYSRHDPVVKMFRIVGQLNNIHASGEVSVMPEDHFADALLAASSKASSDLLLLPWTETGSVNDSQILLSSSVETKLAPGYIEFVRSLLASKEHSIGVFFPRTHDDAAAAAEHRDQGGKAKHHHHENPFGGVSASDFRSSMPLCTRPRHLFLAYFGSSDDKLALGLGLQLLEKPDVTATIVHVSSAADDEFDEIMARLPESLAQRVKVERISPTGVTVEDILSHADTAGSSDEKRPRLILLGHGGDESVGVEEGKVSQRPREDVRSCFGLLGGSFIAAGMMADVLVVKAKTA